MIPYNRLSQIIPADQALANKALSVSLQQIGGIINTTLPILGNTVVNLETTKNLPLISALTEPVPASVANYLANLAGTNGNSVGVCDVLGVAAGYKVTELFANTIATLANINTNYLTTIYRNMDSVVGNVYGDPLIGPVVIPGGQPAAGTYYSDVGNSITAADAAFTGTGGLPPPTGPGLIPVAQTEIGNIITIYPDQTSTLNNYFDSMCEQITQENTLQTNAQIDFANLVTNSSTAVYGLVYSLPTYGQQTQQGGEAQFWEGVADLTTFTGQAMVAAMREGYNQPYLANSGISTNNTIPVEPNPPLPLANLIPSTYTAQEAANLVVR